MNSELDIKGILKEKGASEAQINSKTTELLQAALAEMSDNELKELSSREALNLMEKLNDNVHRASYTLNQMDEKLKLANRYASLVGVYEDVLKKTKENFGDPLEADVMIQAIKAGAEIATTLKLSSLGRI